MNRNSFIFNFKFFIKVITFIVIFCLIFNVLSLGIYRKSDAELVWNNIYDKNLEFDLIAFGNSHCFVTNNTNVLSTCGISSVNVGASSSYFSQTYYDFLEVMKYKHPDIVMIELNSLIYDGIEGYEDRLKFIYTGLYGMKMSKNRIESTKAILPKEEYLNALSPLILYHNNWVNVLDFYKLYTYNTNLEPIYRRFNRNTHIIDDANWVNMEKENRVEKYNDMDIEPINVSQDNLDRLEDIIRICDEKDIDLILFKSPVADTRFYSMAKRFEMLEETFGVKIYDYNFLYDELGLKQEDFYNNGHVNVNGANKVTMHLLENVLGGEYGYSYDYTPLENSLFTKKIVYDEIDENTYRFEIEHFNPNLVYKFCVYKDGELYDVQEFSTNNCFEYNFSEQGEYKVEHVAIDENLQNKDDIPPNQMVTEYFYGAITIE